jgi:hypothetical protein
MAKKLNRGPKALGKIVIPKWALDDELLFEVDDRIGGILFAYRATHEKMDELSRDEMWLDLKLSRRDNKDRMKELGGALFGYRRFLVEMVVSSTANAIDSVRAQIIRVTGVRIDFWKESPRVPRLKLARKVLSLNNVIKHNRGVLRHGSSESADFLIDQCGLPDRADIYLIPFNLEFMLREIYGFLLDLCSFAMRRPRVPVKEVERYYRMLLPDFVSVATKPVPSYLRGRKDRFHMTSRLRRSA